MDASMDSMLAGVKWTDKTWWTDKRRRKAASGGTAVLAVVVMFSQSLYSYMEAHKHRGSLFELNTVADISKKCSEGDLTDVQCERIFTKLDNECLKHDPPLNLKDDECKTVQFHRWQDDEEERKMVTNELKQSLSAGQLLRGLFACLLGPPFAALGVYHRKVLVSMVGTICYLLCASGWVSFHMTEAFMGSSKFMVYSLRDAFIWLLCLGGGGWLLHLQLTNYLDETRSSKSKSDKFKKKSDKAAKGKDHSDAAGSAQQPSSQYGAV